MASYRDIAITADQLEPIHRETVMSMVARRIEQLVRSGDLKAGDRLPPEPDLAQMLRVSRGSLREALKGLMYLGLIKSRAGDGTYIQSSLSQALNQHFQWMILLDEVKHLEIYELRKIIEPNAAALAAKRSTRTDIDSLRAALDGLAEARGNPELFLAFDIQFHDAFAQASGNAAIQATMRMLYHATSEARKAVLPFIDDWDRHCQRHERVFAYIRDHKPVQARKAVLDDLDYAETLLREHAASLTRAGLGSDGRLKRSDMKSRRRKR
ncbi:MAG: FadR/GntR family transcriptional regulator [Terriglobales bacterium]|jgi:GntR family transcriptional regulator, transcriptional repressor for pyruvate dehydrogenase complex